MLISCKRTTANLNTADYNADGTGELTIANLENYLALNKISCRYNLITREAEIDGFVGESKLQIRENAPALIYDDLHNKLKKCTESRIVAFLNVIVSRNEYNPVLEKLKNIEWDGTDRIAEIYRIFDIKDHLSQVFIRKWLMQAVAGLHNDLDAPFSLDMVLVFVGRQGIGKTRFFEHLCSFSPELFSDGAVLDPKDRDSVIANTSVWISELGELGATLKKDIDRLKAFISTSKDRYRAPFGRNVLTYPRHTVYVGTVNDDRFLVDETGNRRFLTVKLGDDLKLDFSDIKNFDSLQLWAQVNRLIENEIADGMTYANCFRLSDEEQQALSRINVQYEKPLPGEEEITDILYSTLNPDDGFVTKWETITTTEFMQMHYSLNRYNSRQVGKVLEKLGYTTITVRDEKGPRKKRYLPCKVRA